MARGKTGISIKEFKQRYGAKWREAVAAMGSEAQRKKYPIKKTNPARKPPIGKFIKADAVKFNRNGTVTLKVRDSVIKRNPSLKRKTATKKRKATAKRRK